MDYYDKLLFDHQKRVDDDEALSQAIYKKGYELYQRFLEDGDIQVKGKIYDMDDVLERMFLKPDYEEVFQAQDEAKTALDKALSEQQWLSLRDESMLELCQELSSDALDEQMRLDAEDYARERAGL